MEENAVTTWKVIARIRSDFPAKFGIPRQSNVVKSLRSSIVFEAEYRSPDALRGLESFSHIWLIWEFSEAKKESWSPTVRPPRLGGNTRVGVLASRSPYRPNPVGLSSVKIESIEDHPELGKVIHILGADLMDGTPIFDIKPYIPFADCHPEALGGFAAEPPTGKLQVIMDARTADLLPADLHASLKEVLAQDPRPSYHHDPERIYGMSFGGFEIRFSVAEDNLTVVDIIKAV